MPASSPSWLVALALAPLVLAPLACSPSTSTSTGTESATNSTTAEPDPTTAGSPPSTTALDTDAMTGVADGTSTAAASTTGPPVLDVPPPDELPPGCTVDSADFMFLLDDASGMHRFDPETLVVEPIGQLACPGAEFPYALTIDRGGTLWALMVDGAGQRRLFTIDPDTLDCVPTAFVDPLPQGFAAFSLAFSADALGADQETLYLAGLSPTGGDPSEPAWLSRVDDATLGVETIGVLALPDTELFELCDLKGSGDARLYAFCSTVPATIAELDEGDASFVQVESLDIDTGLAGAFAAWEGRFWLFTATAPAGTSQVSTWAFGEDATDLVVDDLGLTIVGTANSTCVPYEPAG